MKLIAVVAVLVAFFQLVLTQTVTVQVVNPASGNLLYQQQPVYVTSVSSSSLAGTVTVYVDSQSVGTCQLNGGSCNVTVSTGSPLTVGTHSVYSQFGSTSSSTVTFQVYAILNLALSSTPSGTIGAGVPVSFVTTGSILGTTTAPTGSITIIDVAHNNNVLGSCVLTANAGCTFNYASGFAANNNYTITANYGGDSNYAPAISPSYYLEVGPAATTTASASTTGAATTTAATATASSSGNTTSTTSRTSSSTTGAASTTAATVTTGSTASTATATGTVATASTGNRTTTNRPTTTSTSTSAGSILSASAASIIVAALFAAW